MSELNEASNEELENLNIMFPELINSDRKLLLDIVRPFNLDNLKKNNKFHSWLVKYLKPLLTANISSKTIFPHPRLDIDDYLQQDYLTVFQPESRYLYKYSPTYGTSFIQYISRPIMQDAYNLYNQNISPVIVEPHHTRLYFRVKKVIDGFVIKNNRTPIRHELVSELHSLDSKTNWDEFLDEKFYLVHNAVRRTFIFPTELTSLQIGTDYESDINEIDNISASEIATDTSFEDVLEIAETIYQKKLEEIRNSRYQEKHRPSENIIASRLAELTKTYNIFVEYVILDCNSDRGDLTKAKTNLANKYGYQDHTSAYRYFVRWRDWVKEYVEKVKKT